MRNKCTGVFQQFSFFLPRPRRFGIPRGHAQGIPTGLLVKKNHIHMRVDKFPLFKHAHGPSVRRQTFNANFNYNLRPTRCLLTPTFFFFFFFYSVNIFEQSLTIILPCVVFCTGHGCNI